MAGERTLLLSVPTLIVRMGVNCRVGMCGSGRHLQEPVSPIATDRRERVGTHSARHKLARSLGSRLARDSRYVCHVAPTPLQNVLDKHQAVFQEGLGTLKNFRATIYVDPNARPRYCKARTVPYAMRQLVERELERLVEEGVLEPVQMAEWAAPIVPVLKADKSGVRICGDFRQTVNPVLKLDRYPIPRIEDPSTLSKGKSSQRST